MATKQTNSNPKQGNMQDMMQSLSKMLVVKSRVKLLIILGVITAVFTFCCLYFGLMPINCASGSFRLYLVAVALIWAVPLLFTVTREKASAKIRGKNTATNQTINAEVVDSATTQKPKTAKDKILSPWGIPLFIAAFIVLLMFLLSFFTAPLFMANSYRELVTVETKASFVESVENYDTMQIPVVDVSLADKLGDKKLGEDNFGSQFMIDKNDYTMIAYKNQLYWIAPIEYQGFFQWTNRPMTPGYVMVNATNQADVQIIRDELEFVESAYFNDDLERKIYFQNMTRLRQEKPHLELDDDGRPMFVESVYTKRFARTGGLDVIGAIVTDAKTGKSNYYDTDKVPAWVDRIQSEEVITAQINDWGVYVHGFFNSLFSKKEVTKLSTGLNYVYSNNKMYLQTGMTSIGSDESIVGVAMVDMRTKEVSLNKVTGATEYAASKSAIGSEQAERFSSSDPIMINFNGEPTYFIMLKDEEGLVKRYSYVNVQKYSIVATRETKEAALADYEAKITPNKVQTDVNVDIKDIKQVEIDGSTVYLVKFKPNAKSPAADKLPDDFENIIFKAPISINLQLAFMSAGDSVKVDFLAGSSENLISKIVLS